MIEIWKPIENTIYLVSNYGKVINSKNGKPIVPRPTRNGYLRIHMPMKDGKRKEAYIHRIVAEIFCERKEGCDVINHIDNNPANNRADNLEWTTQKGNVFHAIKQGRMKAFPVVGVKDGKEYRFASTHEASVIIGCDTGSIRRCCLNQQKQSKGYEWKYAEVI